MKLTMLGSGSSTSSLSIRLVALARHLGMDGWDVRVILPSADKYNNFTANPHAIIPNAKLVQPWQPKTRSAMCNLLPYLATSFWALLRSRPNAVYLYKPTPITILGLLPRLWGAPVILDLDDLGSEVMQAQGQPALQYRLVAWCERLALRFSTSVVVTSSFLESLVHETYPAKRVLVLPNGVEPDEYAAPFAAKKSHAPRTIAKGRQPRRALYYFGAVNRLSLIESLLRALPEVMLAVPDARVTIIGGGSALEDAKALTKKLGVASAVTFTGWVDMLDAQNYTQPGDLAICCQPDTRTVRAASNMKVFQYMAMGTVPVVSGVGDLVMYCQDGAAGVVVPPDDPAALAATLIQLLRDPAKRLRLARAARGLAETDYSWIARSRHLSAFIRSVVHPGAAANKIQKGQTV